MKYYLLSDRCTDLEILMTGGLKPEFYIRKRILKILIFDKVLNGFKTTHPESLLTTYYNLKNIILKKTAMNSINISEHKIYTFLIHL